jgi:hypothetical protein
MYFAAEFLENEYTEFRPIWQPRICLNPVLSSAGRGVHETVTNLDLNLQNQPAAGRQTILKFATLISIPSVSRVKLIVR